MNDLDTQSLIVRTTVPDLPATVSETPAIEIGELGTGPTKIVKVPVSATYSAVGPRQPYPPVPAGLHHATISVLTGPDEPRPRPDLFWMWVLAGAFLGGLSSGLVVGLLNVL